MVKRRCQQAELGAAANCDTFRARGITAYLLNSGTLEHAQPIAGHENPRATKLYDRTSDEITLDKLIESEFSHMVAQRLVTARAT
jgi:integrase/recombinase XerD